MNKEYLIVGGHGFIGSHFCKRLNKEDYDVYDINEPNGDPLLDIMRKRKEDINDSINIEKVIETKYKHIVHFGALAGVRNGHDKNDFHKKNCLDLAELLEKLSYEHILYVSSSSVLGDVETAYSLSKKIAEKIVLAHSKDATIVRPFTVYGKYGRPEMFITRCIENEDLIVYGDPNKITRRFTYVEDLIDCIYSNLGSAKIINAMGDTSYTLKEVIDLFGCSYERQGESVYDFEKQYIDDADIYLCKTKLEDVKQILIEGNINDKNFQLV